MDYLTGANTVVGKMARGYGLAYVPCERAYYLLQPVNESAQAVAKYLGEDVDEPGCPMARVSELVVEQLESEGMLLRHGPLSEDEQSTEMAEFTLKKICEG